MNTITKITLCGSCEGKGHWVEHYLSDYHKSEYSQIRHKCKTCEGFGLMKVTTTTEITVEPYNPGAIETK